MMFTKRKSLVFDKSTFVSTVIITNIYLIKLNDKNTGLMINVGNMLTLHKKTQQQSNYFILQYLFFTLNISDFVS